MLLAQCAWDSVLSPRSSFLPAFVHPFSKCCPEVIIWAASVWSIKIGVTLEGPFAAPCQLIKQCIKECEVLSRLLCMTNIFAVKAAKCEHLWILLSMRPKLRRTTESFKESEYFRLEGTSEGLYCNCHLKDSSGFEVRPSCWGLYPGRPWKPSRMESTSPLGSLLQCLIVLMLKKVSLMFSQNVLFQFIITVPVHPP